LRIFWTSRVALTFERDRKGIANARIDALFQPKKKKSAGIYVHVRMLNYNGLIPKAPVGCSSSSVSWPEDGFTN